MASKLDMRDLEGALVIRVSRKGIVREAIVSVVVALIVVGVFASRLLRGPMLIALAVLVVAADLIYVMRRRNAELTVTNLELRSRAYIEGWYGPVRSVPRADIRWMEYQEDTTGPETAHHPEGLYAVLDRRNICLLPYVNEEQAALVIDKIVKKFPDFGDQWRRQSPFGENFTTLGLNEMNPRQDRH